MPAERLTADRLRHVLSYDPETGRFTWSVRASGVRFGHQAGSIATNGYVYVKVDGQKYCAHRLAWLYVHGEWPNDEIDHINGTRADNRIANLRDVPRSVNNQNRLHLRSDNTSGFAGVSRTAEGRWRARACVGGQEVRLGHFDTPEAANEACVNAKRRLYAGFTA